MCRIEYDYVVHIAINTNIRKEHQDCKDIYGFNKILGWYVQGQDSPIVDQILRSVRIPTPTHTIENQTPCYI